MKQNEIYYKAILARDHRFDGKFFVGVKTTGIYCRPICPAQPKIENIEFFTNHLQAEQAGYRPCLRCRPESAPMSPAWIGTTAIVQRAIKVLQNQESIEFNEDQFANLFGVTARHLRRLFMHEIGKTPKQIAFENRLNLARKLIVETNLPLSEITFASGFRSVRRFNDAFKVRFKRNPSSIRRSKSRKDSALSISLPYRPPFNFKALFEIYQSHRIGDLEYFEDSKMHRIIHFGDKVGKISISNDPQNSQLKVDIDFPDTSALHLIISRVRAMFDLNSDPLVIANTIETDKKLRALLKKHQGIRVPSGWDPFETAVSAILGQLVSINQGRTLVGELIDLLGTDSGLEKDGKPIKFFPTPERIANSDLAELRTTGARKQTLITFARAVWQNEISLESTQDVTTFIKKVQSLKGIGPWTANYMALKVLRHTDGFPGTDLILARALELHSEETINNMSPWKGYVAALLWREYTESLKKRNKHADPSV